MTDDLGENVPTRKPLLSKTNIKAHYNEQTQHFNRNSEKCLMVLKDASSHTDDSGAIQLTWKSRFLLKDTLSQTLIMDDHHLSSATYPLSNTVI